MTASKPAFPTYPTHKPGQTMREFYKAAALTGLCANPAAILFPHPVACPIPIEIHERGFNITPAFLATLAGRAADAMLSEDAEFEGRKE